MAFHRNLVSLLGESLPEYVAVARLAIETPTATASSFHGFPAAALLFAVVDTLGSYYRGNQNFSVTVDGAPRSIDGDGYKHFFILNSPYYDQTLTEREIKAIYDYFRNPLTHNGAIGPGVLLNKGAVDDPVFYPDPKKVIECVNVVGLLAHTERAVAQFLQVADQVLPGSHQAATHAEKFSGPRRQSLGSKSRGAAAPSSQMTDPPIDQLALSVEAWASRHPEIERLWLFGSRVQGSSRPDSDLDVAVELTEAAIAAHSIGRTAWMLLSADWARDLHQRLGVKIHLCQFREGFIRVRSAVWDHGRLVYLRAD
jgi:predicted nucleotidyltransferase